MVKSNGSVPPVAEVLREFPSRRVETEHGELPLGLAVRLALLREGATVQPAELRDFLAQSVAKWQLPDAWTFIEAVPRTSVGKFDKKVIRKWYADGELEVSDAD